jgi:YD repeat-containing protein
MNQNTFLRFISYSRKAVITKIFLGLVFLGYGQQVTALYPSMPTSPQAESFKKYGDYAVNNAVGIPDISIPLYEIDHFGYKIPVVLKYNPQPIKQSYNFDVYGYGWGLSVNSSVSRQVNHIPDERTNFNLQQTYQNMLYRLCGLDCHSNFNFSRDLFSVTLPNGSSFDFYMINNNGIIEYLISGERHVKIQYYASTNHLEWFKVTDEDGVLYTFDVPEQGYPAGGRYGHANVSWQLSRIDFPHTPYPIILNNETSMQSTHQTICYEPTVKIGTRKQVLNSNFPPYNNIVEHYMASGTRHEYNMTLLNEIDFGSGRLRIIYKNPSNSFENYVEKIQILRGTAVIREIIFDSFSTPVPSACGPQALRRLQKLTIKGSDNSASEEYGLEYHSIGVGGGTDHWGYLNNSSSQAMPNFSVFLENNLSGLADQAKAYLYGVVARTKLSTDVSPFEKLGLSAGSDPRAGLGPGPHGVLNKIVYPTGGYTTFDFQSHRFLSQSNDDGDYIHNKALRVMKYGGGFRIASIKNYSETGVVSGIKTYHYGKPNGYGHHTTGVGEAIADPTLLTYLDFSSVQYYSNNSNYQLDHPVPYMLLGLDKNGALTTYPFQDPYQTFLFTSWAWAWEATLSAQNFRRLLGGRPPVVYEQVTVYDGEVSDNINSFPTGKTVYKYFMPLTPGYGEEIVYYGNIMGAEGHPYLYNRLLEKSEYAYNSVTNTFRPVKKEFNEWSYNTHGVSGYQYCNWFPDDMREEEPIRVLMVQDLYTTNYTTIGGAKLRSTRVSEYDEQGDSLVNAINYTYNARNQLVSRQSTNSYNVITENMMTYPELSTSGPTPNIIQKMLDKNMISPVIENKTLVEGNTVSGSKTEYAEFPSGSSTLVLPARTSQLEFKPGGPEYALQGEVLRYTPNGNPVEYELKGGKRNVYLWGYGGNYIIAEIKNASYTAVAAALTQLGITDMQSQIVLTVSPNMSVINQLRQQLPDAQVITYTYNPSVGVTSVTQPNGLLTSYEYDSLGRLKEIKDPNGNIREAYQYHFKTQP